MTIKERMGTDLPAVAADGLGQDQANGRFRIERRELRRHPDAHADAEHEGAFDREMFEQQLGVLRENLPRQRLDTAAGLSGFTAIVGDHGEMLGQRVDGIHVLPLAVIPALERGFETARRHHQKLRSRPLLDVMRLDSIERGERHCQNPS